MKTTGTKEWAARNCNLDQVGCENGCRYCYAKANAIRFKRATPESWGKPEIFGCRDLPKRRDHKTTMFPTAHDITARNADLCRLQIQRILESGDSVLVVSKASVAPLSLAASAADFGHYRERVEIRVTIGSADAATLAYWEPGAPCFADRLGALQWAHAAGFKTSVSMEPMLDAFPNDVIEQVRDFVTPACGVWLGRANALALRVSTNCPFDEEAHGRAASLEAVWNDAACRRLYDTFRNDPLIRWKDSIRNLVGAA
jgi:uncharacterized Fe-S cluster-containing radical SAM superfamily protein